MVKTSKPAAQPKAAPKKTRRKEPRIAVAFGGGGARGLAHIHVIETLDEMGIRPVAIAGSSIGAIMGAAMAAGMSGKDIRSYVRATFNNKSEVLSRLWRLRPSTITEMFAGGIRLGQFNIERVLKAFLPEQLPKTFEELSIPLQVVAADFFRQEEIVMTKGSLMDGLAASAAIPALFRPVEYQGRILIDGGIYNPVPFDHLMRKADIVVAVDVVGAPAGNRGRIPSSVDSMFGATQLMMQSITAMKLKSVHPHVFVRPDVGAFRVMDFLKVDAVLTASAGCRKELKNDLETEIARWKKAGG